MGGLTLAEIASPSAGRTYPTTLLPDMRTALCLFAAGFYGRQDAYWLAEAGIPTVCVDIDGEKLEQMAEVYPDGWVFVCQDVAEFAETNLERDWDLVSLDPPTSLFDLCATLLPLWTTLAKRAVILGTGVDTVLPDPLPGDWSVTQVRQRSTFEGGIFWTVIEPGSADAS